MKVWQVNQPPWATYPPKNSRPYHFGLQKPRCFPEKKSPDPKAGYFWWCTIREGVGWPAYSILHPPCLNGTRCCKTFPKIWCQAMRPRPRCRFDRNYGKPIGKWHLPYCRSIYYILAIKSPRACMMMMMMMMMMISLYGTFHLYLSKSKASILGGNRFEPQAMTDQI